MSAAREAAAVVLAVAPRWHTTLRCRHLCTLETAVRTTSRVCVSLRSKRTVFGEWRMARVRGYSSTGVVKASRGTEAVVQR